MKLSALNNKWEIKEVPEKDVLYLSQIKGIDSIISSILISRGINVNTYDEFINPSLKNQMPDPYILKDCEKATNIIADAIENKEKIVIFGDYDVDGGTSTAIFIKFLKEIGAKVDFYIPNKLEEGYGPNVEAFKKLKDKGTDLLITVDCGASAFEALEIADFKTIIVDHHIMEEKLPKANAIINPKRLDDESGLDNLAGVGVAFFVCTAVNRELNKRGFYKEKNKPNLMHLLDLVALGTVCDVMKLTGINRTLVSKGLKVFNKKSNCGLKAMSDLLSINKKINTYHLGFVFGPRLNAGGRLGKSLLATQLLSCDNSNTAISIAQKLNSLNEDRKKVEKNIYNEALSKLSSNIKNNKLITNCAFVFGNNWHSGVLGIVASRLKESFNKPSFVLTCEGDISHGSGRSIKGVDIGSIIVKGKQKGLLVGGGGHAMAAGFSCLTKDLEKVQEFFYKEIGKQTEDKDITNTIFIDAITSLKGANLDLYDKIQLLAPFGNVNKKQKFFINDVNIIKTTILCDKHIKCFLNSPYTKGSLEAIAFNAMDSNLGDFLLEKHEKPISIVGTLDKNFWNGRSSPQFIIEDAR